MNCNSRTAVYAGVVLLARRRHPHLGAGLWLDGWIVGLAGAALLVAFVVPRLIDASGGLALATNLAYPVGDLVLCLLVVGAGLSGTPRGSRGVIAGALAPIAFALSDTIYVVQSADDAMTEDRPYQAARPPRQALAELRRCGGTQFDPRVVPELVSLVEQRLKRAEPAAAVPA